MHSRTLNTIKRFRSRSIFPILQTWPFNKNIVAPISTSISLNSDKFLPPYAQANAESVIDPIRVQHNKISDADIRFFQELLSPSRCLTDTSDTDSFNLDWQGIYKGSYKYKKCLNVIYRRWGPERPHVFYFLLQVVLILKVRWPYSRSKNPPMKY